MSDVPDRVREVINAVQMMHVLATVDADGKPHTRWMGALVEDPQYHWTFYLACHKGSRKMVQLAANPHAELLFTKQETWQVASLSGTGEAVDTPEIRALLWEACPPMRRYYSGVDDPSMGIIQFTTRCMELLSMQDGHEPYCFELEQ
jgi:general stress protein 26